MPAKIHTYGPASIFQAPPTMAGSYSASTAGCHGLAGQGLVGPKLVGITDQRKDPVLVHQIISGETPPMPSFQIEPQSMADLLVYLHDLS